MNRASQDYIQLSSEEATALADLVAIVRNVCDTMSIIAPYNEFDIGCGAGREEIIEILRPALDRFDEVSTTDNLRPNKDG